MGIRIKYRSDESKSVEFDDQVEEIRFGRDPQRNHVKFSPDDTRIGREHFVLRRVAGRYRVVVNEDNPVYIDGEPAYDQQELADVCTIRVGEGGPELIVERLTNAGLPATEGPKPKVKPIHQQVAGLKDQVLSGAGRLSRTRALAMVAVLMAVGAGVVIYLVKRETEEKIGALEIQAIDTKAGQEVLRKIMDAQRSVRQSQQDALDEKVRDAIARQVASQVEEHAAKWRKEMEEYQRRFPRVVAGTRDSVYVMVAGKDGRWNPFGTAWAAAPGILATNGHVVAAAARLQKRGLTIQARSSATGARGLAIESMRSHPGYFQFLEIVARTGPRMPHNRQLLATGGYDVATFLVAAQDKARMSKPLPIASMETLRRLGQGDELISLGFPVENINRGGVDPSRPEPVVQGGRVTSVTDFFLAAGEPDETLLVRHSVPAMGGASGSPILNTKGEVVALLNAGSVVRGPLGERIPVAGFVEAQRADMLREMLDLDPKKLMALQEQRGRRWYDRCVKLRSTADEAANDALVWWRKRIKLETGRLIDLAKDVKRLGVARRELTADKYKATFTITTKEPGRYLAYACATSTVCNIDLGVWPAPGGKQSLRSDASLTFHPYVRWRVERPVAAGGTELLVQAAMPESQRIYRQPDGGLPCKIVLVVFRIRE